MKKIFTIVSLYALPALVLAEVTSAESLFEKINSILKSILPIIISIAVIYFVYQVMMYTISGDEDKKKAARDGMIYGIIGLFVMISIWGLVAILTGTFGFTGSETPSLKDMLNFN